VTAYKVEALSREALEDPWEFEFDSVTYRLPSDFDMRAAAALSVGNLEAGLRIMLGEDQWKTLCESQLIFGVNQLSDMIGAYCEAIGVELGESKASSRFSSNTATPSKRTSNGTTKNGSRASSRARKN
jgi:hypothetical protein